MRTRVRDASVETCIGLFVNLRGRVSYMSQMASGLAPGPILRRTPIDFPCRGGCHRRESSKKSIFRAESHVAPIETYQVEVHKPAGELATTLNITENLAACYAQRHRGCGMYMHVQDHAVIRYLRSVFRATDW